MKLWDTSNWQELRSMSMERSPAVSAFSSMVVFSHNGELIAASNGIDEKQKTYTYVQTLVWKVKTGEKLFILEGHKFDVNGLIFTSDDRINQMVTE